MGVYMACLKPGDTILAQSLDAGGHLTHGSPVNMSGKYFKVVPYGVNDEGFIDYDELRNAGAKYIAENTDDIFRFIAPPIN